MDDALVERFRTAPEAAAVTLFRRINAEFKTSNDWGTIGVLAVGSERERDADTYVWSARPAAAIWSSMKGRDEVLVSEPFANKHGITRASNVVTLRTAEGEKAFTVVGVYYDYASDAGIVMFRMDTFQRIFADSAISSLALYLKNGEVASETAATLRERFAGRELLISANRELRDNALVVFDRTFAITGALNLLATVVAFIGVLSALMALQIERTRELGMLRANGMTLRQLWRMTFLETGLMGGCCSRSCWSTSSICDRLVGPFS
jgi:putative ABC transport system permease protein